MRMRRVLWVSALALLAGCGGGTGGGSGPAPSASRSEARFDVDLKTGKVTITPAGGRAVYQGGAVSFTSSDVLSVSGDAGKRLIRVTAANHSGETWGGSPVKLTVSDVVNADAAALRANVAVSTYAGTGQYAGADGFRTSAQMGWPAAVCQGAGPFEGSLIVSTNCSVRRIDQGGTVSTLAGSWVGPGFVEGTGGAARFYYPYDVASDAAGNVYVPDVNNRRIRRITPLGEVTTIAGTGIQGSADGVGSAATFGLPWGIAVSSGGDRIYVADYLTHVIRLVRYTSGARELATSYTVSTVAGAAGLSGLVDGAAARFSAPMHLALMTDQVGAETLFVTDSFNHAIRRIASPAGAATVSTVAGDGTQGDTDGPGTVARFRFPQGIAGQWLDSSSLALFVTDSSRVRGIIFAAGGSPTQKGSYDVVTLAGSTVSATADGDGNTARFASPAGLTAVGAGSGATLYLADQGNSKVRQVNVPGGALHSGGASTLISEPVRVTNWDAELPNRIAWTKTMTASSGAWSADLEFFVPNGESGFSFLATIETDSNIANLPAVGAATVSTLAGNGVSESTDGLGRTARFAQPSAVVAIPPAMRSLYRSPSGAPIRAFVADAGNNRIRYIDTAGYVGVWAGGYAGFADGVGVSARLSHPAAMALYPDGSLIVADTANCQVRRVWPNQQVTTVAGTGAQGAADGAGDAATFKYPRGVAVNSGGRIYISDSDNNTVRRIVLAGSDARSPSSYAVTTVAGVAGAPGYVNDTGPSARFSHPMGMVCDSDGRVLLADQGNSVIRVLTPSSESYATSATMPTVGISQPVGVALDSARNLYITVNGVAGPRVHRVGLDGGDTVILAGSAAMGSADGSPGQFYFPIGIAVEHSGTLLVTDANFNTLRAVSRIVDTAAP